METEFEAKFYPVNKDRIRSKLKEVGAELIQDERLMPMYIFGKEDNGGMKVDYLRLRDEGEKKFLAAKIHAQEGGKLTDQKEMQIEVADIDSMRDLLELGGLKLTNYCEKKREIWELDGVEVLIDTWPELEPYVEIEPNSVDSVKTAAEKLGFNWEDKLVISVTEIYANLKNVSFEKALEHTRRWTFTEK
jgi:adenylate cyclase class 2